MLVQRLLLIVISFIFAIAVVYAAHTIYVSNLSNACMSCLCVAASNCNRTISCRDGYCGPFFMSKIFWRSAGSHVLPDDDPERDEAFPDCAKDYKCASEIVKFYMARFGKPGNRPVRLDIEANALLVQTELKAWSFTFLLNYDGTTQIPFKISMTQDCNDDKVTDCDDYARIHYHGYKECFLSLDGTNFGRRYSTCRPHLKPAQDYDEADIPLVVYPNW